jgi:hypothetical protein
VESVVPKTYLAFADEPTGLTSIVAGVIGNPLYVALLMTVLALMVVTYVLDYTNGVSIDSRSYLKMFIYLLIASCTLLTFHHSIHVQSLIKEYRSSGIKDVYHTVEGIRSAGIMPSAPVEVAYKVPDREYARHFQSHGSYEGGHKEPRSDRDRDRDHDSDSDDDAPHGSTPYATTTPYSNESQESSDAPDFGGHAKLPRLESVRDVVSYNPGPVEGTHSDGVSLGPPGTGPQPPPPPPQNSAFGYT